MGFHDLYQLLISDFHGTDAADIQVVGFASSSWHLTKALILQALLEDSRSKADEILQVWFSTRISKAALDSLKRALTRVISERASMKGLLTTMMQPQDDKSLDFPRGDEEAFPLAFLTRRIDRVQYARYLANRVIFVSEGDADCVNPLVRHHGENFFRLVDFSMLRDYKASLMETLTSFFLAKARNLKEAVTQGKLLLQLRYEMLTLSSENAICKSIRDVQPVLIDWSDLVDSFDGKKFSHFARLCSEKGNQDRRVQGDARFSYPPISFCHHPSALHLVTSTNWTRLTCGASTADYAFVKEYNLTEMLDSAKRFLSKRYQSLQDLAKVADLDTGLCGFDGDLADIALALHFKKIYCRETFCKESPNDLRLVDVRHEDRPRVFSKDLIPCHFLLVDGKLVEAENLIRKYME